MTENAENGLIIENFSQKITRDAKEQLAIIKNSGDFNTWSQVFDTLVERYNAPIKVKDQTEKLTALQKQYDLLEEKYRNLSSEKSQTSGENASIKLLNENLTKDLEIITAERDKLEQDVINATVKGELPENGHVIIIDPLNWAVLNYVAKREGKSRKQDWTIDDVINYFIHFRFVKGSLNGDLKSVSDKDIEIIKSELAEEV